MVDEVPAVADDVALVPGELRGYRQFSLKDDGLYPLVHTVCGPWDGHLQRAVCASGARHASPATDCLCGLYAWYLPGSATVSLGPVSAVVLARGRCVLGDRGFRAAAARIEAVSLPAAVRWHPAAAARARAMLAQRYPQTRVYPSTRRMLRDHPPQDVSALGVSPPRDRSRAYRAAAAVLWTAFVAGRLRPRGRPSCRGRRRRRPLVAGAGAADDRVAGGAGVAVPADDGRADAQPEVGPQGALTAPPTPPCPGHRGGAGRGRGSPSRRRRSRLAGVRRSDATGVAVRTRRAPGWGPPGPRPGRRGTASPGRRRPGGGRTTATAR